MCIPKIIHQTWKSEEIPDGFAKWVESWRRHHPDWKYVLWTDEANRDFIAQEYPWFVRQYDRYPYKIQKVDAARYFILHKYGGLYVDLDFESLKPIEPLLEGSTCVLGFEPDEHCTRLGRDKIVGNAVMASTPKHPFFELVIRKLGGFSKRRHWKQPVLETTGPFMLSNAYDIYREKSGAHDVKLVPAEQLYPLTLEEADALQIEGLGGSKLKGAYAVHYHTGTWWRRHKKKSGV